MIVNIKTEYILYGVIIIIAIAGIVGREWIRNRKIDGLNAQIEQLTETSNIQKAKLDEMTGRLRAAQTALESTNQYCEHIEGILNEKEALNHAVADAICGDETGSEWYGQPVPDSILDVLYERLCDTEYHGDNKD